MNQKNTFIRIDTQKEIFCSLFLHKLTRRNRKAHNHYSIYSALVLFLMLEKLPKNVYDKRVMLFVTPKCIRETTSHCTNFPEAHWPIWLKLRLVLVALFDVSFVLFGHFAGIIRHVYFEENLFQSFSMVKERDLFCVCMQRYN